MWYFGTILGSICLALSNALKRVYPFSWQMLIIQFILSVIVVGGYWYGFYKAPKFVNCWFLGSAFNSLSAILLGLLIFDKAISLQSGFAILLIFIASYLLI